LQPVVGDELQPGQQGCDFLHARNPEAESVTLGPAVGLAQRRARAAFEREHIESYPRLLTELAERESCVYVERQVLGRHLVEDAPSAGPVREFAESPDEVLPLFHVAHRISHRDPAAARNAVHQERAPCVAEEQRLVPQQGEVG
jgi:hypothetical protein